VVHIYNQPGNYTAYLKVKDDYGALDEKSNKITVWVRIKEGNEPPKAYLDRRPYKVNTNESVIFNASSSEDEDGIVHRYLFDFGDGSDSGWIYEPITTHAYAAPGYYTCSVMVEDDFEAVSEWSKPRGVEVVGNVPPRSYLFSRPHYADIGESVTFNATGSEDEDGAVVSYYFDFGDGTFSGWTDQSVISHRYYEPGNYTVELWVKDDKGETNKYSSRTTITVREEAEEETWGNMAATVIVILVFIALMIAGTIYEVKKVRDKKRALEGDEEDIGPKEEEEEDTKPTKRGRKGPPEPNEEEQDDEEDWDALVEGREEPELEKEPDLDDEDEDDDEWPEDDEDFDEFDDDDDFMDDDDFIDDDDFETEDDEDEDGQSRHWADKRVKKSKKPKPRKTRKGGRF
jgi:PKD repeat protein